MKYQLVLLLASLVLSDAADKVLKMGQPCESSSKCLSGFCGMDESWAECGDGKGECFCMPNMRLMRKNHAPQGTKFLKQPPMR